MNDDLDQLVQEMCEMSTGQNFDQSTPSPVGRLLEITQGVLLSLPWDHIRKHYPTMMTAFVVLGILAGGSPTPDDKWGGISWGVTS